jgi:hypothetical protein
VFIALYSPYTTSIPPNEYFNDSLCKKKFWDEKAPDKIRIPITRKIREVKKEK